MYLTALVNTCHCLIILSGIIKQKKGGSFYMRLTTQYLKKLLKTYDQHSNMTQNQSKLLLQQQLYINYSVR